MKYVRTTTNVEFRNDALDQREGFDVFYETNVVGPGFICQVVIELDHGDTIIKSVKYPKWIAEVSPRDIEEINAMEFLAEVHAGNVPDEALEKTPCE